MLFKLCPTGITFLVILCKKSRESGLCIYTRHVSLPAGFRILTGFVLVNYRLMTYFSNTLQ